MTFCEICSSVCPDYMTIHSDQICSVERLIRHFSRASIKGSKRKPFRTKEKFPKVLPHFFNKTMYFSFQLYMYQTIQIVRWLICEDQYEAETFFF